MPRGILVIADNLYGKYDFSLEVLLHGRYCYGRGKGYPSVLEVHQGVLRWLERENRKNGRNQENAKIP